MHFSLEFHSKRFTQTQKALLTIRGEAEMRSASE
jgi:hypothetical protein